MESEREIEKLLREYAVRRREAAGRQDLHPVTRRNFQNEIARIYVPATTNAPENMRWWGRVWPKVALGFGLLFLLTGGLWIFNSERNNEQGSRLAALKSAPAAEPKSDAALARAARPEELSNEMKTVANRSAHPLTTPRPTAATSPPEVQRNIVANAPALTDTESPIVRGYGLSPGGTTVKSRIPSSPTVSLDASSQTSPATLVTAPLASSQSQAQTFIQKFSNQASVQVEFESSAKPAPATTTPVLASFQVEQAGNQLRIVDKDGSIYAGSLLNTPMPAQEVQQRARFARVADQVIQAGAESLKGAPNASNLAFQVVGTNRTLNQKVVFQGTLLQNSIVNRVAKSQPGSQIQLGVRQFSNSVSSDQLQWLNTTISGKALLGPGKEIPVEAVPE